MTRKRIILITRGSIQYLHLQSYHKESEDVFLLMKRNKYEKLRNGSITPIPVTKTKGLSVWSGYSQSKTINISKLRNKRPENVEIKK